MTITIRKAADRGHADHGWLKAAHTFSFADYYDPEFTSFGPLRVLNHDLILPSGGFQTHGHQDMEIITYVMRGAIEHRDSMGNGAVLRAGEVQTMTAGSGIRHSEFNASDQDELELLQMWIMPREQGTTPKYDQRAFPAAVGGKKIQLAVSPDGRDGSLVIGQDALLYLGQLAEGEAECLTLSHDPSHQGRAWIHVGLGRLEVNGIALGPGDGAAIDAESTLHFTGHAETKFVVFDLPLPTTTTQS